MPYEITKPLALVTQRVGANGGAIWIYKDGDALSTVTAVNYVTNATDLGLKAGDRVIHIDETTGRTTDLTALAHRTSGTANGALCAAIEPIGETSIVLQSAGTGTFLIDDMVEFSTEPGVFYRLTTGDADISGGGTLVITPSLAVATAVGTTITVKTDVINLTAGAEGRAVYASSAATRLLQPAESGGMFLFDAVAGQAFTLPEAVVGLKYSFMTIVDLTSNAFAVLCSTATAGDFLVGAVQGGIEGAATDETHYANGTTHLGISSNSTTTGGLIGGWLELECITVGLWSIRGSLSCTATPATPFTT
jgi:hypothetical protein